jgi:hypothetical protein
MNSELTWSNVISKANVSFNKELQNNIFSDLPFSNVFPLNKSDLSIFARNVLRGFHYISSTLKFKSVPFVQKSPIVHKSQKSRYKTKLHENKTIFLKMWGSNRGECEDCNLWDVALSILEEVY